MMKVMIISDTHSHEENLEKILQEEGMPDHLIHLGDSEKGEHAIRNLVTCPLHMVAGNCDFFSNLPKTQIIEIDGQRILITHGHYYYVSVGTRDLVEEAKVNHCTIAMFGHTHKPFVDQSDPELTVLNPGSLSFPRQEGRRPSYITMDLEENKAPVYEINYL